MMNGSGKSDSSKVPAKLPNKAEGPAAEAMEGRGLAKGNSPERNALRTQSREGALSALERVRQAAKNDKKQRFAIAPRLSRMPASQSKRNVRRMPQRLPPSTMT